jgi:hypothetical protein
MDEFVLRREPVRRYPWPDLMTTSDFFIPISNILDATRETEYLNVFIDDEWIILSPVDISRPRSCFLLVQPEAELTT